VAKPIELSVLLERAAGPEVAVAYREALYVHHWLWRWLGISDQRQLGQLRQLLMRHGLLRPSPDPGWIVNRGLREFSKFMPGLATGLDRTVRETLDGHTMPTDLYRIMDSGAGNGTASYEMTRPWAQVTGIGLEATFPVDGTLRNWLAEEHRAQLLPGYRSQRLYSTLLTAEIFSAAAFAARQPAGGFDPVAELASAAAEGGGVLDASLISRVSERTREALDSLKPQRLRGKRVAAAVALGFLIDGLAGRVVVPNGPGFCYEDPVLAPEIFAIVQASADGSQLPSAGRLAAAGPELAAVRQLVERHRADHELPPTADMPMLDRLGPLAELLKGFAFELRRKGEAEHLVGGLHILGNTLWQWQFFLTDRPRWADTTAAKLPARSAVATVRRWLEHPWGALRREDLQVLFGGRPTGEDLPDLIRPLSPLLREGLDPFLRTQGLDPDDARPLLSTLIERRCALRDLRGLTLTIRYPATHAMRQADLLVNLITQWYYGLPQAEQEATVAAGLRPLGEAIERGDWVASLRAELMPVLLSRQQTALLDRYTAAPRQTARQLFELTPDQDLAERVDFYPLEEFWVGNVADM
jgi:hypothetical protein